MNTVVLITYLLLNGQMAIQRAPMADLATCQSQAAAVMATPGSAAIKPVHAECKVKKPAAARKKSDDAPAVSHAIERLT